MRKLMILICCLPFLVLPVYGMEFLAPEVPDAGAEDMPSQYESFGDGLFHIIRSVLEKIQPNFISAGRVCISLIAVAMLTGLVSGIKEDGNKVIRIVRALMIGCLLLQETDTFFGLALDVIHEISDYGKLLLPVMAAALAAQGGVTGSAGIYAGTLLFDSVMTTAITGLLLPLVYVYIALSIADAAFEQNAVSELKCFVKWVATWLLKIILYIFTGYISITGVVSGTADAAAIKAAKVTISSIVPMVGSIISDASETILVSAGVMKNAAGIYGILAVLSLTIDPFIKIGIHYLLLRVTAAACSVICEKDSGSLMKDFSVSMGFLLAMTGAVCVMELISIVCFMKGVA